MKPTRDGTEKRKCEECDQRPATLRAGLRPVDWDGVGKEPVEQQRLCDECLATIPEDERIWVRPYKRKTLQIVEG